MEDRAQITTAEDLLPGSLRVIAEIAGDDVALAIVEKFAGQGILLPTRSDGNNWLAKIAGAANCDEICERLGFTKRFYVPIARYWRVCIYKRRGLAVPQIATRIGTSERTVRLIVGRLRQQGVLE